MPVGLPLLACLVCAPAAPVLAQTAPLSARVLAAVVADAAVAAGSDDLDGPGRATLRVVEYCAALAASPWPRAPAARRALLHRFEILRNPCIGHAGYLAALGALWLEEGEPAQALIWLERSLLLDPDQLGAVADHALALAALGEPAARDALAQQWQSRSDVPAALRQRLMQGAGIAHGNGSTGATSVVRPANTVDGWVFYREASWVAGYETNLDHSPRLTELTLTPPDRPDPVTLPVESRPSKGAATIADLSWQLAYSPRAGMIVQTGLQGGARYAPAKSDTDWRHVQWAASVSQQWGQWRGQVLSNLTCVGGGINEAYRLGRFGVAVDREAIGCSLRVSVEGESRSHQQTRSADGRTLGALWSSLCPWPGSNTWGWGAAARHSVDEPVDSARPGGVQRQSSLGLRLFGPLGKQVRLDASLRASIVTDSEGYSALLENNAIRRLNQTQLSLELARPLQISWLLGAEALVQLQAVRQSSNLAIFRYHGFSAYGGLRWRW